MTYGRKFIIRMNFILQDNAGTTLEPKYKNTVRLSPSITDELSKYVSAAVNELKLEADEKDFLAIIKKYLYHAFNTNKEKLGQGFIGLDAMERIATHPAFQGLPFILETPNDDAGYIKEIAMVNNFGHN